LCPSVLKSKRWPLSLTKIDLGIGLRVKIVNYVRDMDEAIGAVGDMEERSALMAVSGSRGYGTGWLTDLVFATKSAAIGFGVEYVTVMDEYVIG